ncbi:MAG: ParB/RepB/Spo0J family partition protein [Acidobacteriota bacterium]|nr:ParB/RepB/Spo0J family partition protein [Acidobacteriota bacterium]
MSKIEQIEIERVLPNPFRWLETYPYSEEKLSFLMNSIEDTGFWEGVIARKNGNDCQLAFGHHRVESARRLGLKHIPLIIRELSDEQMLQMLGRENMEDYKTSFSVIYATWEAAHKLLSEKIRDREPSVVEVSSFLGWTYVSTKDRYKNSVLPNHSASAASKARSLFKEASWKLGDLEDLPITAVMHLIDRATVLIKQSNEIAESQNHKPELLEKAKEQIVKAVQKTADEVREGKLATDKIRHTLDVHVYEFAHAESKPRDINFAIIGKQIVATINKLLATDATGKKLDKIKQLAPHVSDVADKQILLQIETALALLAERVAIRQLEITKNKAEVAPLKLLKGA